MQNLINTKNLQLFICLLLSTALWGQDYDIYRINVQSGEVQQVTNLAGVGEFNPSFSNNGQFVVYDVVLPFPPFNVIAYTEISTGFTDLIPGVFDGNDASWSPNGNFIAFDRGPVPSIWMVPAGGGAQQLVRELGVDAEWSQNSQSLVFFDLITGAVKTINLGTGTETEVAEFGLNPNWSNNGKYIAYTDGNNLYKVRVNQAGEPQGSSTQLTFDDENTFNQQPSWSNNGKTIVFHSNRDGGDFDIWTIPAKGGTPTRLTGLPTSGDFDPAYSKNGQWVAYASLTSPPVPLVAQEGLQPTAQINPGATKRVHTYPNPFWETITFHYELLEDSKVTLQVFDTQGRLVATLVDAVQNAGINQVQWNGQTAGGAASPAGIYTYTLLTDQGQQSGRIIRIQAR